MTVTNWQNGHYTVDMSRKELQIIEYLLKAELGKLDLDKAGATNEYETERFEDDIKYLQHMIDNIENEKSYIVRPEHDGSGGE